MAATRLAQARIEALKGNGADIACWDGELTGFGVRVRKNYVLQPCVRGKMRRFTVGQRGRVTPDEATVASRGTATVSRTASRLWP